MERVIGGVGSKHIGEGRVRTFFRIHGLVCRSI